MISPNKLIGSVVLRTMDALNKDAVFLEGVKVYEFWPSCLKDGQLHLWHYPGTPNEISNILVQVGKLLEGASLKFPAVLDYHPIRQRITMLGNRPVNMVHYNLAIIAPVRSNWTTEEREKYVFEPLLRPIYEEFVRQVKSSPAFYVGYAIPHDYYEVFTTGSSAQTVLQRYGDYIDAIELHNLALTIRPSLCSRDLEKLYEENDWVTDNIDNILKY
jgi:hypothetical protein